MVKIAAVLILSIVVWSPGHVPRRTTAGCYALVTRLDSSAYPTDSILNVHWVPDSTSWLDTLLLDTIVAASPRVQHPTPQFTIRAANGRMGVISPTWAAVGDSLDIGWDAVTVGWEMMIGTGGDSLHGRYFWHSHEMIAHAGHVRGAKVDCS